MPENAIDDNRPNILFHMANHPGDHIKTISRRAFIPLRKLRYKLLKLEKQCSIVSQKQGKIKINYAFNKPKPEEKELAHVLHHQLLAEAAPGIRSTFNFIIKADNVPHIPPLSDIQLHLYENGLLNVHSNNAIGEIIENRFIITGSQHWISFCAASCRWRG